MGGGSGGGMAPPNFCDKELSRAKSASSGPADEEKRIDRGPTSKFTLGSTLDDELGREANKEWSATSHGFCCACWYCFSNFVAYFLSGLHCLCTVLIPNMCCWSYNCCSKCCYHEFDALEPQMDTGDIFIFGGTRVLKYAQMSPFSHLGMVYVDTEGWVRDVLGQAYPKGTKFIFEANYSGDGTYDGACFVPLKYKVVNYKKGRTDVVYRALGESAKKDPNWRKKMDDAVKLLQNTPYDHNEARGLNAILDCCDCCERAADNLDENKEQAMFCSELIAAVYQKAGLLASPPEGPPHSEYVPRDFANHISANIESGLLEKLYESNPIYWIERLDKRWCWNFDWFPSPIVLLCCCCCNASWPCCNFRELLCKGGVPEMAWMPTPMCPHCGKTIIELGQPWSGGHVKSDTWLGLKHIPQCPSNPNRELEAAPEDAVIDVRPQEAPTAAEGSPPEMGSADGDESVKYIAPG